MHICTGFGLYNVSRNSICPPPSPTIDFQSTPSISLTHPPPLPLFYDVLGPNPFHRMISVPTQRCLCRKAKQDIAGPFLRVAGVALGVVGFFSRFLPKSEGGSL